MTSLRMRQARLLADYLGTAKRQLDSLMASLAVPGGDAESMRIARETAEAAVLGFADALERHQRAFPDPERTPRMSSASSQTLRAVSAQSASEHFAAANAALSNGRNPQRDEP